MKLINMLFIKWLFAAFMLLFTTLQLSAQDSCTLTLRIYDRFGDGWDGSKVYIKLGNNAERSYTHDGISSNAADSIRLYSIRTKVGDSLIIRYASLGNFQSEIKYSVFNNLGDPIYVSVLGPTTGIIYRGVIRCSSCGSALNARISAVRSATATITWNPTTKGSQPTYMVEWDTAGFRYGTGRNKFRTTDTFGIITNLNEVTNYSAYVQTVCVANDSSLLVGPLNFKTDTATNVGVINILNPVSSCNLGIDSIKIVVKNFAGAPQQLIPFKVSINGQLLNIPFPADGLFTGVLSKDSTTILTFKTVYDFSTPNEYVIAAWTDIADDKNKKNDTFRVTVVRPRLVNQYPYIQNFENGRDSWAVQDTTPTRNSTWQLGTPNYRYIQGAASGLNAWTIGKDTSYNNNEFGYLLSPCFDFSSFTTDPRINFAINVYSEKTGTTSYDGAWLEGSTDEGKTWSVLGGRGTGINWYQDTINTIRRPVWSGTTKTGWFTAQNTLKGMAGKPTCRLRFGFRSDVSGNLTYDGVAIDNIVVGPAPTVDLAVDSVTYNLDQYMNTCQIALRIANLGTTAQSNFSVGYRLGNGTPVTENVTNLTVQPNSVVTYRLNAKVSTPSTDQRLVAWVNAANDVVRVNDSLPSRLVVPAAIKVKTLYDFNSTTNPVPSYWTASRSLFTQRGGHGNPSVNGYIYANVFTDTAIFIDPAGNDTIITPGASSFTVTAGKFGTIRTDDTLRYDYRFVGEVSPYSGYNMSNNDTLKVLVATECDTVFTLIDTIYKNNHTIATTYRTRAISLARFAGQVIKVRFQLTSSISDYTGYYIDIDNLNILSCPASFGYKSTITDATYSLPNGKIILTTPSVGTAPYTFAWSNNTTKDSLTNVFPGAYTVTITDSKGCSETKTLTVKRSTVNTNDPTAAISRLMLSPNPTTGDALLEVEFNRPADTRVQVFNPMGQLLYETRSKATEQQQFNLDMSNKPAGVYLVRVTADNKSHVVRLVKQ